MPAEERHVASAEGLPFGCMLQSRIVWRPRLAFEHELAGGPDVREIRADWLAQAIDQTVGESDPGCGSKRCNDQEDDRVSARGGEPAAGFDGLPHRTRSRIPIRPRA
jgi:hypothetical protein